MPPLLVALWMLRAIQRLCEVFCLKKRVNTSEQTARIRNSRLATAFACCYCFMGATNMYKLVRKENFNLSSAKLDVWYELWKEHKGWFGRTTLKPVFEYNPLGMGRIVHGDLIWAKRVAKHYDTEVPKS